MPLDHGYGVAIGQFHSFTREDPDDYGMYYHGFLKLLVDGEIYECAIDVDSHQGTITVEHRVVEIKPGDISTLRLKEAGYYDLDSDSTSGAIDYIRSKYLLPFRTVGCLPGIILSVLPFRIKIRGVNTPDLWTEGNGAETLDVLEAVINDGENARFFVLGEPYHYGGKGIHNVHQNQGDPVDSNWHAENGIWQDGCTIIEKKDGRIFAFLNKFSSQAYLTDENGYPIE